jgi:hypothetical protein
MTIIDPVECHRVQVPSGTVVPDRASSDQASSDRVPTGVHSRETMQMAEHDPSLMIPLRRPFDPPGVHESAS